MTSTTPDRLRSYLREHHVMTLATQGSDGPWAAAVFYAERCTERDFRFVFLSSPASRHGRNLAADPRVGATIQRDYGAWPEIRGVQLEGTVHRLENDDEREARALYASKYPAIADLARAPAAIVRAFTKIRWYELRAERVFFIDNSVAFGHREEVTPEIPRAAPFPRAARR